MEFFTSAIDTLKVLVIALGAGLGVWGVINLLEGYGNDNPGANTQGFYSIVPDEPDHKVSLANDGKGFVLWWCNASDWEFHDGICSIYCKGKEHTEEFLVMSFHITGQEVA